MSPNDSPSTAPVPPVRPFMAWRVVAMTLSALTGPLLLAGLAWGLWWWSGSAGALATMLNGVSRLLPAGQVLSVSEVTGNLHQGGRIGQLLWQKNGLHVAIRQADVRLDWTRLWHQPWPVAELRLGTLHIDDRRPPQAPAPWSALSLPLTVKMDWQVDRLMWQGMTEPLATGLRGRYVYDGDAHDLRIEEFQLAKGRYSLLAKLQATAPMALDVHLKGQVSAPARTGSKGMALDLLATVQGTLSGAQAELAVQAQLAPAAAMPEKRSLPADRPGPAKESVHLQMQARLQPWQAQPVVQAQVTGQALDLALLWPGAPLTHLNGQARVTPSDGGWQMDTEWHNLSAGPWDMQRLPMSRLRLQANYQGGLWQVVQARAQVADGQLQGRGRQTPQGWTGLVELQGLVPGQLHTALTGPPVRGQVQAKEAGSGRIDVQADLNATGPSGPARVTGSGAASAPLQWEHLLLQAQWQPEEWDIRQLTLEAAQARLKAQFKYQPRPSSLQGQAQLSLPGLQAQLQGLIAPKAGQGLLELDVQEASQSLTWLQRFPFFTPVLQGFQASGEGHMSASWQGGFAQPDTGIALSLNAPKLQYKHPAAPAWQLRSAQLQVQGRLTHWQARADMDLAHGQLMAKLETALTAKHSGTAADAWQGELQSFRLNASDPTGAGPWRAELQKPVPWQGHLDRASRGLEWQAARWSIQGPTPGVAKVFTDAGQWQSTSDARTVQAQAAARWEDLPLNWLQGVLGSDIQSDVLLQGQWQMKTAPQLSMSALLQRSSGDLRIQADSTPGQRLPAGLREARLQMSLQGERIETALAWDSEHMGQIQARAQTQLSTTSQGWQWDAQAPVQGWLEANLPKIGAWSLLAPPGWRVQGTLSSRLDLSGTRSQPQWQGRLQADDLAVRSAVQGIEFSQGQLRARLQGQDLVLERLSLRGAGAQGGELQAQGQLNGLPSASGLDTAQPMKAIKLMLQIQAKGLRVSNRADRRLALSGDVTAEMDKGLLRMKGLVQADQALFILPEETTPSLGSDVLVQRANAPAAPPVPPASASWLGTPDVQIRLDLGSDFQVQGQGLNTRLSGQVLLVSNSASRGLPRLTGQVRTEGGRYKAYGQQLAIDTGVLRFNGPYDNPNLDIIALRPNLSQRVGVQVTGTALLPRIRLYADPEMPEADKLAWLVLGRSAASGGAESAVLQQAALVLLGGNVQGLGNELASSLGLDEVSLASGSRSDANATGAAVTLGKRLSKDFYMAYESSLSGTFGSLYIFYDLSRQLTLRAQAGQLSALDLIFTVRKD